MAQVQSVKPTQTVSTQPTFTQPVGQVEQSAEPKSIFKKWWFWLIIVCVLAIIGLGIFYFFRIY
jgi:hypothetical protein